MSIINWLIGLFRPTQIGDTVEYTTEGWVYKIEPTPTPTATPTPTLPKSLEDLLHTPEMKVPKEPNHGKYPRRYKGYIGK